MERRTTTCGPHFGFSFCRLHMTRREAGQKSGSPPCQRLPLNLPTTTRAWLVGGSSFNGLSMLEAAAASPRFGASLVLARPTASLRQVSAIEGAGGAVSDPHGLPAEFVRALAKSAFMTGAKGAGQGSGSRVGMGALVHVLDVGTL